MAGLLGWLDTTGTRLGRTAAALDPCEAEAVLKFASEAAASVCAQSGTACSAPHRT